VITQVITAMVNPVTRSVVRLSPEYTVRTKSLEEQQEKIAAFTRKFDAYCDEQWQREYRGDPVEVNPYAIMRGTVTADVPGPLHEALRELLAEHGSAAVRAALTDVMRKGDG
jgi:hypothetical protein